FLRRRREFITLLGGAAVTLPRIGFAQPAEKLRRIGIFAGSDENDARARGHVAVFQRELERLGWTQEHNVRIEHRWTSDPERMPASAAELVSRTPDVILTTTNSALAAVHAQTASLLVMASDPGGAASRPATRALAATSQGSPISNPRSLASGSS